MFIVLTFIEYATMSILMALHTMKTLNTKLSKSLIIYFILFYSFFKLSIGRTGIRTLGPLARTTVFKTVAFNRSAILPINLCEWYCIHIMIRIKTTDHFKKTIDISKLSNEKDFQNSIVYFWIWIYAKWNLTQTT